MSIYTDPKNNFKTRIVLDLRDLRKIHCNNAAQLDYEYRPELLLFDDIVHQTAQSITDLFHLDDAIVNFEEMIKDFEYDTYKSPEMDNTANVFNVKNLRDIGTRILCRYDDHNLYGPQYRNFLINTTASQLRPSLFVFSSEAIYWPPDKEEKRNAPF